MRILYWEACCNADIMGGMSQCGYIGRHVAMRIHRSHKAKLCFAEVRFRGKLVLSYLTDNQCLTVLSYFNHREPY